MKTGDELWAIYRGYTHDFTKHGRKLGFGGAALCWLFKREDFTFPVAIYAALLGFVIFFAADALQSLLAALVYRLFTQHHEAKQYRLARTIAISVDLPRWLDRPAFTCFCVKALALCVGFGWISVELIRRIF